MFAKTLTLLKDTEKFIIGGLPRTHYGGDQEWFGRSKEYRKEAACGATTCANILGYLARTRDELVGLAPYELGSKEGFLEFMKAVYPFVRPGLIGIMPADFTRGAEEYSAKMGFEFGYDILTVPAAASKRPVPNKMFSFISSALEDDLPVAFLNLSSGHVRNLDSYHWVTLVGLTGDDESSGDSANGAAGSGGAAGGSGLGAGNIARADSGTNDSGAGNRTGMFGTGNKTKNGFARIVDNGNLLDVDLNKWLKRSTLGGAFVVIEP